MVNLGALKRDTLLTCKRRFDLFKKPFQRLFARNFVGDNVLKSVRDNDAENINILERCFQPKVWMNFNLKSSYRSRSNVQRGCFENLRSFTSTFLNYNF